MTAPVHVKNNSEARRLVRNLDNAAAPRKQISKSQLMTIHLWAVEKVHGRLSADELRSAKFTKSRDEFLGWAAQWL